MIQNGSVSLIPSDVTVGSKAQVVFNFFTDVTLPQALQPAEIPEESIVCDVSALRIEVLSANSATIYADIIPWQCDEIELPAFTFSDGKEFSITVSVPPLQIRSVSKETNATQLSPAQPPFVIPGTTYAIYGSVIALIVIISLISLIISKMKKLKAAIHKLIQKISYSRNYRKLLRSLKRLRKRRASFTETEAATYIVKAIKNYLEKRFSVSFEAATPSEFSKIIKDNKIPCHIEYINTLEQVCKSCDVIRFAENSFLFEKQLNNFIDSISDAAKHLEEKQADVLS